MLEQIIQIAPFNFLNITEYNSTLKLNEHGIVVIKGIIESNKEEQYLRLISDGAWTEIHQIGEDGTKTMLFCGLAKEGQINSCGGVKELTLKVITGSSLLDVHEHTRSFENEKMTKSKILKYLVANYPDGYALINSKCDGEIGEYLCQYKETDWQFIKRIASGCDVQIIPNYINRGVKFFFGLPDQTKNEILNSNIYAIQRNKEITCCIVKIRENYCLGQKLNFNGRELTITSIKSTLEGSELYHSYELIEADKIYSQHLYNEKLRGVSLCAKVTGVKAETVQLEIQENEYKEGEKKWFSYATIYSSLEGSGWYCMPEVGDAVRLYFASDKEKDAFVMNAVHLEPSNSSRRVNPDHKSIMNKYGKEILITPSSLTLTNNAGMAIELSDDKGVHIISDKQIEIESEKEITLMSTHGKIDMVAQNAIVLQQGSTSMVLSEKLRMQGARIKME